MTQNKKKEKQERTPEELYKTARTLHRQATEKHVLVLEGNLTENQKRTALYMSKTLGYIERRIRATMRKRLANLAQRKDYKRLRKYYHSLAKNLEKAEIQLEKLEDKLEKAKTSKQKKKLRKDIELVKSEVEETRSSKKEMAAKINRIIELEGVAFEACREIAAHYASKSSYPISAFALAVAEDVWRGVEKILYSNARKLGKGNFHRNIRAKQADKALVIKQKDGKLFISNRGGIGEFGVKYDEKDIFAKEELAAIIQFIANPEIEERAVRNFMDTGEVTDNTFRPIYANIVPEKIRGKWRFWCQITVEGRPLPKKKRDGTSRHDWSAEGELGIDQGVSDYAVVGENICEMKNLAERNRRSTFENEAKERNLQRKMDRSRRANNPDNYNDNGTIKKGKKTWVKSKTYQRDEEKLADIKRKNAASRKYAVQEDVNRLRGYGDVVVTEKQSIAGLAKKARPRKKADKKTGKMKHCRRKRFGRSIQNRCPGLFRAELKKKFREYIEVDLMFRASQYDHESDDYVKKKLSQRTHHHSRGRASPRDAYSAFLLWCHDTEYEKPDRGLCIIRFENYYDRVQAMVAEYKERGVRVLNSGF